MHRIFLNNALETPSSSSTASLHSSVITIISKSHNIVLLNSVKTVQNHTMYYTILKVLNYITLASFLTKPNITPQDKKSCMRLYQAQTKNIIKLEKREASEMIKGRRFGRSFVGLEEDSS